MENAEEVFQCLEDFTKRRPKVIPRELEEYLNFVARTGDPVYQWALVKNLFKEKLLNVITEFFETSPGLDIPQCPNVDLFHYETMKNSLLEKIDAFSSAPFTVQRICELLTSPRKQYTRIDKFMRAFEKNILVVSTRDPGPMRRSESENGEGPEGMVNGSDSNSEYNLDVEMDEVVVCSWKDNPHALHNYSVQSGSSETSRSAEVSNTPIIAQNGPAREERAASDVELMTIEPDTHLPATEDPPDPSASDRELPSNEETKTSADPLPEVHEEPSRAIPDTTSEEKVIEPDSVESRVADIAEEAKEEKEVVVAAPESPKPSIEVTEEPPATEISKNIEMDAADSMDEQTIEDNLLSPDTSTVQTAVEPDSMECQESEILEEIPKEKEVDVVAAPESPKSSTDIIVTESVTEVSKAIEMDVPDNQVEQNIEESLLSPVVQEPPESPKKEESQSEDIEVTNAIETVPEKPTDEAPTLGDISESVETEERVTSSIEEVIPEASASEPACEEPEVTSSKESDIVEPSIEAETSNSEVENVSIIEKTDESIKPLSPVKEKEDEVPNSGDS